MTVTDEAIEACVKLSNRYISDRFLPDKAIDLMDEASSRLALSVYGTIPKIKKIDEKLKALDEEKENAIINEAFEEAAAVKKKQNRLRREKQKLEEEQEALRRDKTLEVTFSEVAEVVAGWTKIPVKKLEEEESEKLMKLEQTLHKRVIGQQDAVSALSKAIRRGRVGLKDPNRPIGSFLFLGPTGVGKTELSKALAEALFGSEDAMIRVDMSEYMEKHSVSKMIGSPPGYVGYDEGGQLTEAVRRKPYSVVLFDEIEKAHPDVFNILLQCLDDGRITDSFGKTVDFKNTIIILTSNIGSHYLLEGITEDGEISENAENMVMDELKASFRPEFLNRLDEIICFKPLTKSNISSIIGLMVNDINRRLDDKELSIELTDAACSYIADNGFDPVYGARPLKRFIQKNVETLAARLILEGKAGRGDTIVIDLKDDVLTAEKK